MPVAVPFVEDTRLLVSTGMRGATGNVYLGLHEFEDMAFVLHALRVTDLFVDVGANVGTYTVLAGGAVGARCVAAELVPSTFDRLRDNVNLNGVYDRVRCCKVGLGSEPTTLRITTTQGAMNHVWEAERQHDTTTGSSDVPTTEMDVTTLDAELGDQDPEALVVKIDVEGWEPEVIRGGENTLSANRPIAALVEFNESGQRYGFGKNDLRERLANMGFRSYQYDPWQRLLHPLDEPADGGNTLYLNDRTFFEKRTNRSSTYRVFDTNL